MTEHIDVSIKTATNILYIEDHHIYIFQVVGIRSSFCAIQRDNRNTSCLIYIITNFFTGIGNATKTVFRTEDHFYIYSQFSERINKMCITNCRGLIGKNGNSFIFYQWQINIQSFCAGDYLMNVVFLLCWIILRRALQ